MKRVVSVSLGSASRDHQVEECFLGQRVLIERIGTDGDMEKATSLIRSLDGKVDAFGLGGIDLYISAGHKKYLLRDAKRIADAAKLTPIVDGSGLKNTLERRVISYLQANRHIDFNQQKVLMVCAADRFGMAEALSDLGCDVLYGDLIFGLGIPIPLYSLTAVEKAVSLMGPFISRLPFKMLYPTGSKQESFKPKHQSFYQWADLIAGDFHFIRRHMPPRLNGKTIITNTVTKTDLELMHSRGVNKVISTTPELNGRSFGTNVIEGVLIAISGKKQLSTNQYNLMLDELDLKPRIINLLEERIV